MPASSRRYSQALHTAPHPAPAAQKLRRSRPDRPSFHSLPAAEAGYTPRHRARPSRSPSPQGRLSSTPCTSACAKRPRRLLRSSPAFRSTPQNIRSLRHSRLWQDRAPPSLRQSSQTQALRPSSPHTPPSFHTACPHLPPSLALSSLCKAPAPAQMPGSVSSASFAASSFCPQICQGRALHPRARSSRQGV